MLQKEIDEEFFMRIDKFLKVARVIKRRTIANEMADKGRIFVNEKQVKPSYEVKIGDIVEIKFGEKISKFKIIEIPKTARKKYAGDDRIIIANSHLRLLFWQYYK